MKFCKTWLNTLHLCVIRLNSLHLHVMRFLKLRHFNTNSLYSYSYGVRKKTVFLENVLLSLFGNQKRVRSNTIPCDDSMTSRVNWSIPIPWLENGVHSNSSTPDSYVFFFNSFFPTILKQKLRVGPNFILPPRPRTAESKRIATHSGKTGVHSNFNC